MYPSLHRKMSSFYQITIVPETFQEQKTDLEMTALTLGLVSKFMKRNSQNLTEHENDRDMKIDHVNLKWRDCIHYWQTQVEIMDQQMADC